MFSYISACIPRIVRRKPCAKLCYCSGAGSKTTDNDSDLRKLIIWAIWFNTTVDDCKQSFTMSVILSVNQDKKVYKGDILKQRSGQHRAQWVSKSHHDWDIDTIKNITKVEIFIYLQDAVETFSLPAHSLYISCPNKSQMFQDNEVFTDGCK